MEVLAPIKRSRPYGLARSLKDHAARRLYERGGLIDTGGVVSVEELGFADREFEFYEASPWTALRRSLAPYRVTSRDVFADLGAGKGRVALQAATYPFGRVIGVELSERLAAIARENAARARGRHRAGSIEIVTADATRWEVPDELTFAYLYNPFTGDAFQRMVARLAGSLDRRPRKLVLIYAHPVMRALIDASGRFELVSRLRPRRPDVRRHDPVHWINVYESR